jgi:hypothetical protein
MGKKEEFIEELGLIFDLPEGKVTPELNLKGDLAAGSMQLLGIVATFADLLHVDVAYNTVKQCTTIGDVLKLYEENVK